MSKIAVSENIVEEAIDIMPEYQYSSDLETPMQFIEKNWRIAENSSKHNMILYIEEHPFDGCEEYLEEWDKIIEYHKSLKLYPY